MAKRYFIRIQLHDAAESSDAYDTLHEEMERRHFARTVAIDGKEFKLPWGTYIAFAKQVGTKQDACTRASEAARITGYSASIVVAETDVGMQVSGLEPVEPTSAEEDLNELERLLKSIR